MVEIPIKLYVQKLAKLAREAVRPLSLLSGEIRNQALLGMATRLEDHVKEILAANQ